jgi:hypothetical protein
VLLRSWLTVRTRSDHTYSAVLCQQLSISPGRQIQTALSAVLGTTEECRILPGMCVNLKSHDVRYDSLGDCSIPLQLATRTTMRRNLERDS